MNTKLNFIILALALTAGFEYPAFAATEGTKPAAPQSNLDNWDDDVWADWGAQPTPAGKGDEANKMGDVPPNSNASNEPPLADSMAGAGAFGSGGGTGFGESEDRIRFRLVRDGSGEGPKGVRKFRPTYGRKSL